MCRLALIGLLLCATAATLTADFEPKPITVPVEFLKTRHFAVQAKIDGKGPYRLIFDTGAPVVLLNSKIAREAKLFDPKRKSPKAKGASAMSGQTLLQSIEVGGAKAEAVPATVFDHPTIQAISSVVGEIDGIVGHPFFARFRTTVDYQAKTLTFVPNGHVPSDVFQSIMGGFSQRSNAIAPAGQWGVEVDKSAEDVGPGVVVRRVLAKAPAHAGGIQVGDRILTIDGRWTDSVDDCFRAAAAAPAGKPVAVRVDRGGREMTLQITPQAGS